MLNWKIIAHPMNWLVVFSMLAILAIFGHLLLKFFGVEPSVPGLQNGLPQGYQKNTVGTN